MIKYFLFHSKMTISCNFQQKFVEYKYISIFSGLKDLKFSLEFLSESIKNVSMCKLPILIIMTSNIHA